MVIWPDAATTQHLHRQLEAGDPVASSQFAEAFLDPLAEWLLRKNPRVDPHLCETAAADAIIAHIRTPATYDPERGTLDVYLRVAARGDLLNLLEKERRHAKHRTDLEPVELFGSDRKNELDAGPDQIDAWDDEESELFSMVRETMERMSTPEEQRVLQLLIDGERTTAAFAAALGISDLPELDQRRAVKQAKDRIKKRLLRARSES